MIHCFGKMSVDMYSHFKSVSKARKFLRNIVSSLTLNYEMVKLLQTSIQNIQNGYRAYRYRSSKRTSKRLLKEKEIVIREQEKYESGEMRS